MKIDAKVQSISKLKDYFFLVPDYQREYVWKPDDEVEQFLIDIENEYSPDAKEQRNYFLGSIIIVNNDRCFDVVDGQQRLTTIMLSLCVFRDLLKKETLYDTASGILHGTAKEIQGGQPPVLSVHPHCLPRAAGRLY